MSGLAGKRVLVTRALEDQQELAALLLARAAEPVALPCIEFSEPLDEAPVQDALRSLSAAKRPDFLVLASPHAADRFLSRVNRAHLAGVQIAAAGAATARRVEERGLQPLKPSRGAGAEALLAVLAPRVRGKHVLVPRAEGGNPGLVDGLERAGARVTAITLYRTVPATSPDPEGARLLRAGGIDAITFASGSAARGFAALFGSEAAALASAAVVACMGNTCATDARAVGLRVAAVADGGLPDLVKALESAMSTTRPRDPHPR
jgi:uroporphyrinogen III methyltransferase / synthase